MYVRFISPRRTDVRGVDCGLFQPAGDYLDNRDIPESTQAALRRELNWFNTHLAVPAGRHFQVKSCRVWYDVGICWFRADAREMIARAFVLASLLGECGLYIRKVATRDAGQILYRDEHQIIAKPRDHTPTRWH